ncbi:MAG: hypothetical protein C0404_10825 [Verrucomicrobia bacterium]|nr:hypothetical protein [Verrucomicrobiota bacterium]
MNGNKRQLILIVTCAVMIAATRAFPDEPPHDLHCTGHDLPFDYAVDKGANGIEVGGVFSVGTRKTVEVSQVKGYAADLKFACVGETITITFTASDSDDHVCQWLKDKKEKISNQLLKNKITAVVSDTDSRSALTPQSVDLLVSTSSRAATTWTGAFKIPEVWGGREMQITFATDQAIDDDAPCTAPDGVKHEGGDTPFSMNAVKATFMVPKVVIDTTRTTSVVLRGSDARVYFTILPYTFVPSEIHLGVFDGAKQVYENRKVPFYASKADWDGKDHSGWSGGILGAPYAKENEYRAYIQVFGGSPAIPVSTESASVTVDEISPVWLSFKESQALKDNTGKPTCHADGAHWKRAYGTSTALASDVRDASYHVGGVAKADVVFGAGVGNKTYDLSSDTVIEIYANGAPVDFAGTASAVGATVKTWPSAIVTVASATLAAEIHYYDSLGTGWRDDKFRLRWIYRVKSSLGTWSSWIHMKNQTTSHYMCLQRAPVQPFPLYEQIVKWGCGWAEGEKNDEDAITKKLFDRSISDSGLKYEDPNPALTTLGDYLTQGRGMCQWTSTYLRYANLVQAVDSRSVFFGPWNKDNWAYIVCPGKGLGGTDGPISGTTRPAWNLAAYYVHDHIDNPLWSMQASTVDIDYNPAMQVWVFQTKQGPGPDVPDGHVINWLGQRICDLSFMKTQNMIKQPTGDQNYSPKDSFRKNYFDANIAWLLRAQAPCHDATQALNEDLCLQSSKIPVITVNFADISMDLDKIP